MNVGVSTARNRSGGPADHTPDAVELRSVICVLDDFPLLAGVDMVAEAGSVTLVSGPNGAGKTSLLRLLAGVLPLTSGHARVLDVDLAADRISVRKMVALVAQENGCYEDLSVRRNLNLHADVAGVPRSRVPEIIEMLDLARVTEVAHRRLSTGQRRRCALAIGLARDAQLLLLDEPHAGLDTRGRDVVDAAVAHARTAGATVVLVSHELDRARALADNEVVLAAGCSSNSSNASSS